MIQTPNGENMIVHPEVSAGQAAGIGETALKSPGGLDHSRVAGGSIIGEKSFRESFVDASRKVDGGIVEESAKLRRGVAPWGTFDRGMESYDINFAPLLGEPLGRFLEQRKLEGKTNYILDVMGTGLGGKYPLGSRYVDGEVAITLVDPRTAKIKASDANAGKMIIAGEPALPKRSWSDQVELDRSGSVVRNTPWLKAQAYLTERGLEGFDLVTFRPMHGWNFIRNRIVPRNPHLDLMTWMPIQRAYALTSPQEGRLLVQMPGDPSDYSDWLGMLRDQGLNVKFSGGNGERQGQQNFLIVKDRGSPVELPKMT